MGIRLVVVTGDMISCCSQMPKAKVTGQDESPPPADCAPSVSSCGTTTCNYRCANYVVNISIHTLECQLFKCVIDLDAIPSWCTQ